MSKSYWHILHNQQRIAKVILTEDDTEIKALALPLDRAVVDGEHVIKILSHSKDSYPLGTDHEAIVNDLLADLATEGWKCTMIVDKPVDDTNVDFDALNKIVADTDESDVVDTDK